MNLANYFDLVFFLLAQIHDYLFSKSLYNAPDKNLKIKFTPRSMDPFTYFEIFIEQQYKINGLNVAKTVVDIGANIGLFTLWTIQKLKTARVISIEMDKNNFENMSRNIKINNFQNKVTAVNKAFYNKNCKVAESSSDSNFLNTCPRLDENRKGNIETITFSEILNLTKSKIIDLVKMDIEGSEKFLLTPENKTLLKSRVKFIIIEAHPEFGCTTKQVVDFLSLAGFTTNTTSHRNLLSKTLMMDVVTGKNSLLSNNSWKIAQPE